MQESETVISELKELLKKEKELNLVAMDDLSRGLTHKFRNFISAVSGSVQYCLSKLDSKDELKTNLETTCQNIDHMTSCIDEFLKITYMPEMNLKESSIAPMLEETISEFSPAFEKQKIEIIKHLHPGDILTVVEPTLLKDAFSEVIKNAIESMPHGGVFTVVYTVDSSNSQIQIKFRDTGCGIEQHQLPEIFQPFFNTEPNKKGLGLYKAKRIIDIHWGKIDIESIKTKGTAVSIILPLTCQSEQKNANNTYSR